eukprot:TRINITY_DN16693_c0_g1_i1.p1 TRINITY_DN16693_c0_g1~~TRINITY_DN16693_c0_g1_i1.p1  ORF type:complete len:852 (+),score=164.53 TRINITY_DN16693_c0_g1_i1:86-2641(+)
MQKRLVKFPDHVAHVRLQCEGDGYEGLLSAVQNHRYAKGEGACTLFYNHKLEGGEEVPVEIEEDSFSDLTAGDVIFVDFDRKSLQPESVLSSSSNTLQPQHASRQPPPVPKLQFNLSELRHHMRPGSGSSTRQKEVLNSPIQTVEQAMKYLQGSNGRMEAVKVPRFFRSVNCPFRKEDLWQELRSKMSRDGFVDHQDLLKMIAEQSDSPILLHTPRTCVNGKDHLPLGASAVSPLPAGKSINDVLQQYDSGRSRSSSRERTNNNTDNDSNNTKKKNGPVSSTSFDNNTFNTSFDMSEPNQKGTPNGFSSSSFYDQKASSSSSVRAATAKGNQKVLWDAYEILTHNQQAISGGNQNSVVPKLDPRHLPMVLSSIGIEESADKVNWILSTLRITEGRYLSKKDIVLVISEILGVPPDKAHSRAVSRLSVLINTQPSDSSSRIPMCLSYSSPFSFSSGGGTDSIATTRRSIKRERSRMSSRGMYSDGSTQDVHCNLLPRRSTGSADSRQLPLKCANCFTELDILQTVICGSCRMSSYCSDTCLSEDWPKHEPICGVITRHSHQQKMTTLCGDDGAKFHVRTCQADGLPGDASAGGSYLFIISQRVPHIHKVFVVFVSADGKCDYSHPAGCENDEAIIHDTLRQVFEQVFAESIQKNICTLAACCLLPLRAYYCQSELFSSLVRDYLLYFTTFVAEALSAKVCHSNLRYNLIVPPLETLCEAFESRALQVSNENNNNEVFLESVTNAKDYYLLLLSFLQDTAFTEDVQNRAVCDRRRIMKKISIVYQHLAARDTDGRVMSYLKRSETVLLRLIAEVPTSCSYNQLALLYDCLPHDPNFQQKAADARKKAREAVPG